MDVDGAKQKLKVRRRSVSGKNRDAEVEPLLGIAPATAAAPNVEATKLCLVEKTSKPKCLPDKKCKPTLDASKELLLFKEVPSWLQDNPAIVGSYRRLQYSYKGCCKSLLYIHNETGNIYSHLLGAILFAAIAYLTYVRILPLVETNALGDSLVIFVFFVGAFVCLACSSMFHLFICHSQSVAYAWSKIDYIGIVFLIVASFFPMTYYTFHCRPTLAWLYLSSICTLGVLGIIVSVFEKFGRPEFRVYRTLIFVSMGLSGFFPMTHALILYGYDYLTEALSLHFLLLMGLLYVIGAVIYASRVPERWFPGKFDVWFHSHQIFHILVVAAALTHYVGVMRAYKWWHSHPVSAQCHDTWYQTNFRA